MGEWKLGRAGGAAWMLMMSGCTQWAEAPVGELASDRTECAAQAVLDLLNDAATTADTLRSDLDLYSRAADSLMDVRDGADDVHGTSDDTVFVSMDQVDAVPQVGTTSMATLDAYGDSACADADACVTDTLVATVNDLNHDRDWLVSIGVYSRGADGLVADRPFDTVEAIDATPYVGPASMDALYVWANATCEAPLAEVVFSPQDYEASHLARVAELMDGAEHSIDIAMYSFSDWTVRDALQDAAERGVSIRLVSEAAHEHSDDPAGTWSADFEDWGIEVVWVNKVMHHKFAIFDGPRTDLEQADDAILATGSGNWSYSAGTRYDENTVVLHDDPKAALAFQKEFEHMWTHSRPVVWNESIESVLGLEITDADIAAAAGSEVVFTTANFRTYESSTYGWTFALDGNQWHAADALVNLIEGAESSIWVASGHLRSTSIAQALLDKHAADPQVDIRVYLDGQEFTSAWYYGEERAEYDACEAEAIDEDDHMDCLEIGVHWGYALHDQGLPIRYKFYAYRWDYTYADQMHHKTLIVDGDTVASGSYNWSPNGEQGTIENLVLYTRERYPALVDGFVANHAALWETGRSEGLYDSLLTEVNEGTDDLPLVFDSMALTWSEVDVLKDAIQLACPDVDSEPFRTDPRDHTVCER